MVVARIWDVITQRGNDLYVTLRYESAKALRESMHSAVREGIDVAAGRVAAQGQGSLQAVAVSTTELPALARGWWRSLPLPRRLPSGQPPGAGSRCPARISRS
jgi:hypothetical protein